MRENNVVISNDVQKSFSLLTIFSANEISLGILVIQNKI